MHRKPNVRSDWTANSLKEDDGRATVGDLLVFPKARYLCGDQGVEAVAFGGLGDDRLRRI
jgi:hypothetical protein